MQDKEQWMEICRQIAVEQDPKKFSQLVHELSRLLAQKDERLKGLSKAKTEDSE